MAKSINATQRRSSVDDATSHAAEHAVASAPHPRSGDRLLDFEQTLNVTTLTEGGLRWLRHSGEGPPMFKLGRRLVCWESDLLTWIEEHAAKQAAH